MQPPWMTVAATTMSDMSRAACSDRGFCLYARTVWADWCIGEARPWT